MGKMDNKEIQIFFFFFNEKYEIKWKNYLPYTFLNNIEFKFIHISLLFSFLFSFPFTFLMIFIAQMKTPVIYRLQKYV